VSDAMSEPLPSTAALLLLIQRAYWGAVRRHVRAQQAKYAKRVDRAMELARVSGADLPRRRRWVFDARFNHRHWRAFYLRGRELDAQVKTVKHFQRIIDGAPLS
jgi:hypothetical protein